MAILKFLNQSGEWEVAETPAAVKYTEQTLTGAQKAQAKTNLSINEVETYENVNWFATASRSQLLDKSRFVKMTFVQGQEPYCYLDGDLGNPIRPSTLFIYASTQVTSSGKTLWLETVVNGRTFRLSEFYNADNSILMSSSSFYSIDEYNKTTIETNLKSKIAIYNNVTPSTFSWWNAINYALNNTSIEFGEMQTGSFQLNLASDCYFTGFATFGSAGYNDGDRLTSALVKFTVAYYGGGCHSLVLTIEHNGDIYKSAVFDSYPGQGTDVNGYGFVIPDSIPFTKVSSAMIVEITSNTDGTWSSSKTPAEIYAHVQNGGTVYAKRYDDFWSLQYASSSEAQFCTYTDDGFIYRMWIWGSQVEIWDNDPALITSTNLIGYLDNNNVAYKSDIPTAIPTSTIDALFS